MSSNNMSGIVRKFYDIVEKTNQRKTSGYDTAATVTRVDRKEGKAWVHIPGGVDETPVRLTINAKVGDDVQIRVSGGSAYLTGNATAPPTDDRVAIETAETSNKYITEVSKQTIETTDDVKKEVATAVRDANAANEKADGAIRRIATLEESVSANQFLIKTTDEVTLPASGRNVISGINIDDISGTLKAVIVINTPDDLWVRAYAKFNENNQVSISYVNESGNNKTGKFVLLIIYSD